MPGVFPAYLRGIETVNTRRAWPSAIPGSQPTYEGLKHGCTEDDYREYGFRSQPTYEGLKRVGEDAAKFHQQVFPAYLRGIETGRGAAVGENDAGVPSLPTRD